MKVTYVGGARAGQVDDHQSHVARRMIQMGQARVPKQDELEAPATKVRTTKGGK